MTGIEARLDAALADHMAGRFEAARRGYLEILAGDAGEHRALHLLGVLALDVGRPDLAIDLIGRAIALADGAAAYHNNLGNALRAAGRIEAAIAAFRAALARMPDHPDMLINLGAALAAAGEAGAEATLRRALALAPERPDGWFALASLDGTAAACRRAVRLDPGRPGGWFNLGNALRPATGGGALPAYRHALVLAPEDPGASTNLGALLRTMGHSAAAVGVLDRALRVAPDSADAHWNRGWARAARGEFPAAWGDLEWRLRLPALSAPAVAPHLPLWAGEALAGKHLLLYAEQGLGDAIQFARYIPLLAREAAVISVVCHAPLVALFRASWPGVEIRSFAEPSPAADLRLPLMSVPAVRRVSLADIPGVVPYLTAPSDRVAAWARRIGDTDGLRVGLCWRGNWRNREGRHRAVPVSALAPLAEVSSLRWFDLTLDRADTASPPWRLVDLSVDLSDLGETAAALANLDLVVSIDTSVAHLAGALGRPTWLMLAHAADWRWLEDRDDSPWYPTMRLFRQPAPGDWAAVVGDVTAALRHWSPAA